MDEKIKELLYRSFDETLKPEDSKVLEYALANSDDLLKEKEEIAALRNQLYESTSKQFKPFFAERVLKQIQTYPLDQNENALFDSLMVLFKPVAIAATVLIILVSGYNIADSGNISLEGALAIPDVTFDDAYNTSLAMVIEEEE